LSFIQHTNKQTNNFSFSFPFPIHPSQYAKFSTRIHLTISHQNQLQKAHNTLVLIAIWWWSNSDHPSGLSLYAFQNSVCIMLDENCWKKVNQKQNQNQQMIPAPALKLVDDINQHPENTRVLKCNLFFVHRFSSTQY
jgi:hypothetical protein